MFGYRPSLAALLLGAAFSSPSMPVPSAHHGIPFYRMGTPFKRSRVGAYSGMSSNRKTRNRIRNRIAARSRAANR